MQLRRCRRIRKQYAGVLRAGGLEDMTPENFEFVTKINYNAYVYCAKTVSRVMKLQNKYAEENYGDIIQINSKSGLRGSKPTSHTPVENSAASV